MSDFKGYWKNYEDENYVLGSEEYCAQQAWKHQQARIDDLQKTIVSLEAGLRKNSSNKQKLLSKNIELQKRVDLTLNIITDIKKAGIEMEKTPNVHKVGMVLINFMSGLEIALRGANG